MNDPAWQQAEAPDYDSEESDEESEGESFREYQRTMDEEFDEIYRQEGI